MNIKKLLTRKNIIWMAAAAAIFTGGYFFLFNKKSAAQTLVVHPSDFLQQVSASGTVVAKENLDLSFAGTDQVSGVFTGVGKTVYAGQLLASQSTGELQAQYLQMKAGVDLQQAKLGQLLAGNSPQDIQTAKSATAAAQQNIDNTYTGSLNTIDGANTAMYNASTLVALLQSSYFYDNDQQGLKVQDSKKVIADSLQDAKLQATGVSSNPATDSALAFIAKDLRQVFESLGIIRQLCQEGVYAQRVSATDKTSLDTQKTAVNTSLTAITATQSNIASYKVSLQQAQDALALKQAPSRPSDIAVYQAQIDQAKAGLQNVAAQLDKKRIYSPINGIVTAVNAKVGSVFSANDVAVSVISKNDFQIESYVPQINISLLLVGQSATVTLDSFGDTQFTAKVISIDPAQTMQNGVSTYKVTLELSGHDARVKSGMTGNVVITTLKKSGVISVPQGIVVSRDGQKYIQTLNGKTTSQTQVTTGAVASNGNIEILSGLKDGDTVILK